MSMDHQVNKGTGRAVFERHGNAINRIAWACGPLVSFHLWACRVHQRAVIAWNYVILKSKARRVGNNVAVFPHTFLVHIENLEFGDNCSIHPMCYLDAEGGIVIGNNVSIAHSVTIMSANHTWEDQDVPIKYCPKSFKKTVIHDDVWIGAGSKIMAGVEIMSRVVVASGSVVTKNLESGYLYGGIPAVRIKNLESTWRDIT